MSSFTIRSNSFDAKTISNGLYVVSTPIGNLADITIRALEVLASADLIACEDTRVTGKLLSHYGIKSKMIAYHEHNAKKQGEKIITLFENGKIVALTSDAGTPLVSDPGQRLVSLAREKDIPVYPIPGPSAPLAAISVCGFSTERFSFFGFLPNKKSARKSELQSLRTEKGTLIFFESPSRLAACLQDMVEVFSGDRKAAICRELTKLHEEVRTDSLDVLSEHYQQNPAKGEIVIILEPDESSGTSFDLDKILTEFLETMSVSRAASEAASLTGQSKREVYQRALALKKASDDKA